MQLQFLAFFPCFAREKQIRKCNSRQERQGRRE